MSIGNYFSEIVAEKAVTRIKEGSKNLKMRKTLAPELVRIGAQPTFLDSLTRPFRDIFSLFITPLVPDSYSFLNRSILGEKKQATWARRRSVSFLRTTSRAVGLTINELLVVAICGALHSHFRVFENSSFPRRLHCSIPVNMHSNKHGAIPLRNEASVLLMPLPVFESDRMRRLARCVRVYRDLQMGFRVSVLRFIMRFLGYLPKIFRVSLLRYSSRSMSLGFTNVPGPPTEVKCGGHSVQDIRVLAGSIPGCGVVLTALQVGMWSTEDRMTSPQRFIRDFDTELDFLLE